jgi:hypothetical protein
MRFPWPVRPRAWVANDPGDTYSWLSLLTAAVAVVTAVLLILFAR